MSTHADGKDRSWEGDMFPVKATDTLARWEKMILWGNETRPGGSPHEIVSIIDLEEGDMVEWFDPALHDGSTHKNTGLVIRGPIQKGDMTRASVLMRQMSYTAWLTCPCDKPMFVRLVDRSRVNMDPMSR